MNKTLISRDHRSKYYNPNSPRHVGHYVSPIPDANSSIYDIELEALEKNLSQREEKYLIDLKNFYEGVEKYKKFKLELEEFAQQLKQPYFSLEEVEEQLHDIQKILNDRAREADYSIDSQPIIELENEVMKLEELSKSPMSEKATSVAKMLSDAQELETSNSKFFEELEQRKLRIEHQEIELNQSDKDIDVLEKDEFKMNQIFLKDKEILDSLPKLELENILLQERLKEDLQSRKNKLIYQSKNFKINTIKANEKIEKLQIEIQSLGQNFSDLNDKKKSINFILSEIRHQQLINQQLFHSLEETDEYLKQLRHTYENQNNYIYLIEKKREDIKKKINNHFKTKKKLDEKDQMLKHRRRELDKIEDGFKADREELNSIKKKICDIEKEVEKREKSAKSMMNKVNEVQEQLQEIEFEIIETSSTSSMKDLKDLMNNIDSS